MALCIPFELSDSIFELYDSGLMTFNQVLTRNLYKYLHLYIMSCRGTYPSTRNNAIGLPKLYMTLTLWSQLA